MSKRLTRRTKAKKQKEIVILSVLGLMFFLTVGYATFSTTISLHAKGNIIQKNLYVSSNGSDVNGKGTIAEPYATIGMAYSKAKINKKSTIYIMDNITATQTTVMDGTKDIVLTSCTKINSETCITSEPNSIIRGDLLLDHIFLISNGNIELNNITLDGNNVEGQKPLVFSDGNNNPSIVINENTTIKNALNVNQNTSLLENVGAAITTGTDTTLTINDGMISNNNTIYGSAIFSWGNVIINNGTIADNTATTNGGAMYLNKRANLTINNGTIANNTATLNGGAILLNNSSLTINDGKISGNNATNHGGGVYGQSNSTINIQGGTIENNTAGANGGGIGFNSGTINMTNGFITGNIAGANGGGISSTGTINFNGGTISNNTAVNYSGIYNIGTCTPTDRCNAAT